MEKHKNKINCPFLICILIIHAIFLLSYTSYVKALDVCSAVDLFQPDNDANVAPLLDSWRIYLNKYLQVNAAKTDQNYFPSSPTIDHTLFKTLQTTRNSLSTSITEDVQYVLTNTLKDPSQDDFIDPFEDQRLNVYNRLTLNQYSVNADLLLSPTFIENLNSSEKTIEDNSQYSRDIKKLILSLSASLHPNAPLYSPLDTQTDAEYNKYLADVWSRNTQKSIVLNNLYYIMRMREKIPDLGKKANLLDSQGNLIDDASVLQVEKHLANKRVTDTTWYDRIENGPPIELERESLAILAQMRRAKNISFDTNDRTIKSFLASASQVSSMSQSLAETIRMKNRAAIPPPRPESDIETPNF